MYILTIKKINSMLDLKKKQYIYVNNLNHIVLMKRNIIEENESQKKQKLDLYIRVAKNAPRFQGSRTSVPVNEFDIHECSPEGLIIPLLGHKVYPP